MNSLSKCALIKCRVVEFVRKPELKVRARRDLEKDIILDLLGCREKGKVNT